MVAKLKKNLVSDGLHMTLKPKSIEARLSKNDYWKNW